MSCCGIVILAAGASTRMGSPKQLLEYRGASLIRRAVDTAIASVCRPIVVVLGANASSIEKQLRGLPVTMVHNPHWSAGMGTSIRSGTAAIGKVDAAVIFLCDQPLVTASLLDALVVDHFASGSVITAAAYAGTSGTPVVFGSSLFEQLLKLEDSQGGKTIIQRYRDQVRAHPMPEAAVDVDTAEDFARLKS